MSCQGRSMIQEVQRSWRVRMPFSARVSPGWFGPPIERVMSMVLAMVIALRRTPFSGVAASPL